MAKYDILITTYNHEKYIERCLTSALSQNYFNYNVIVIDDGSTDNTKNIINKYISKYSNLKYYYKENTGIADTRNYAISKVESEFFLFLDSDDYLSTSLLNDIDSYVNYDIDIVSFSAYEVNNLLTTTVPFIKPVFDKLDGKNAIINFYSTSNYTFLDTPWGYIYNTNYFKSKQFKYEVGTVYEDALLTPIVITEANNVVSTNILGYYYVQTLSSITRDNYDDMNKISNHLSHLRKLYNYFYNVNFTKNEFEKISWKLFYNTLHVSLNLTRKSINEYLKIVKKLKLYETIPINSKTNKLYRFMFKHTPYVMIIYYLCFLNNFKFNSNDRCWNSYLYFIQKNSFNSFMKMRQYTKNYYVMRIKRLFMFIFSTIKYLPALKNSSLYLDYVEQVVTTKCNLNCAYCSNLISKYKNKAYDIDYHEIINESRSFLKLTNKIAVYRIIGGEPFVYKDLEKVLTYLIKNRKIERIEIVSNGNIIPTSLILLNLLSNRKITVQISKYSKHSNKIVTLENIFNNHNIKYEILDFNTNQFINSWYDFGDLTKKNRNEIMLKHQFKSCPSKCNHLLNGKLYLCARASHLFDLGYAKETDNDFI